MSLNRYRKRRDASDLSLASAARALGWRLWRLDTPCDYLGLLPAVYLWRPIEIKSASGVLTVNQTEFHELVRLEGAEILLWRTVEDVQADTKRLRGW